MVQVMGLGARKILVSRMGSRFYSHQWGPIMEKARKTGFLGVFILFACTVTVPAYSQTENRSLYQRMGGYDTVASVVDEFFERFDADPRLAPYLGGINTAEAGRIRQHVVDFICARAGGPCVYHGRDMRSAHEGLGIPPDHFDAALGHLRDALEHLNVGERERRELLSMVRDLRSQMVGQ